MSGDLGNVYPLSGRKTVFGDLKHVVHYQRCDWTGARNVL